MVDDSYMETKTTVALQGLVVTTAFTTPGLTSSDHSVDTNVLCLYGTIYLETLGTWFQDCGDEEDWIHTEEIWPRAEFLGSF